MSLYPEHDKLALVKTESQTCGEFLEWLEDSKGLELCEWWDDHRDSIVEPARYIPRRVSIQNLLAEFFKIDLEKLEAEKELMLEKQRELNNA